MDNFLAQQMYRKAIERLMAEQNDAGIWCGQLSSSPLATATAAFALYQVDPKTYQATIEKSLQWLAEHQNADGGWGDTDGADPSNLSTTLLCRAAIYGCRAKKQFESTLNRSEQWLCDKIGSLDPKNIVDSVCTAYGKDKTFAIPILTMCALAGCLGENGWQYITPLPFELAIFPRKLFRWLNLSVVSYALPALIAIGQVKFHFDPPGNPLTRYIRSAVRNTTLSFLHRLQPTGGGFLEAAPLTAFVTMSLAAMGKAQDQTTKNGVDFLMRTIRPDGSWPIDTDLATWLTTLSVNAFGEDIASILNLEQRNSICNWLLRQQFQTVHPFTAAAPGGWGWTDAAGAVPDADDTAGALVALYHLDKDNLTVRTAAQKGIRWLLDIQNADGGVPTFCRGWGKLPFDRSCPDITAHAVQAWVLWQWMVTPLMQKQIDRAIQKALSYLHPTQTAAGGWLPLWFGNPLAKDHANRVYGTARVILSLAILEGCEVQKLLAPAVDCLLSLQKPDGSWSADGICQSSVEETAIAVAALAEICCRCDKTISPEKKAVEKGRQWLADRKNTSGSTPIGLYFARLWYYEPLYRFVFTVQAFRPGPSLSVGK